LSFGAIDDFQIGKSVREARVLQGTHSLQVLGFSDKGPLGIHLLPPQEGTLSVTVSAGHRYVVRATWTNVGRGAGISPWVEDKATRQVVAGMRRH